MRQLHTWHWISSAVALVGLLLFTVTGFTLNHASEIAADPVVTEGTATLTPSARHLLDDGASNSNEVERPVPEPVIDEMAALTGLSLKNATAEWSSDELYLSLPRPGGDAWIAVNRDNGNVTWEKTDRGWISYLNDLHKGRDTGPVWRWFIDVFALGSIVFIGTGFVLMWLHSRNRPATWPVTGIGLIIPVLLALFFIH